MASGFARYWRLLRLDSSVGILPVKQLLEISSVRSFESLPSSDGIGPDMLLSCKSLEAGTALWL
ncbi:hypothetical protein SAY87_013315 [Trapa incisa]|uniref:Uncharacterized protein n=1 Tax=Trapa incisa TaxID=236973 RepID=A0AAN7QCW9_9MYRT|nr:hypothetical protein SAY87_013315 [Trapa incisa]